MTLVQKEVKRITIRPNGTEKQIRPVVPWWQPWPNTLAYYKLEEDLNDYSWNNRNLSMWGWSYSYSTLTSGKKYCVTNVNAYTSPLSMPFDKNAYTMSGWFYITTKSSNGAIYIEVVVWSQGRPRFFITWSGDISWICWIDNTWVSRVSWQWYYVVATHENWTAKCYVNGNLVWTRSFTWSWTSWNFYINPSNANYRAGWWVSEIIIENKTRTQQEISDYYDQTKWNYWL